MAPSLLYDLSQYDLTKEARDAAFIESVNPHRGDMRLLDGIIWEDIPTSRAIAYKDVRDDEFWVPGHIPGRPIFPGVLMVEAAAQLASYLTLRLFEDLDFLGFAGVDAVKFRGTVTPGDRLYILIEGTNMKPRRSICNAQGIVGDRLVFEAKITGMPV
ncbi:MAG: 3-hydroxyacyl-ACP dehydratase FabZ family protein [Planctomycetota bacterium]